MYETKVKDTGILDDRISSLDCKKGPHFFSTTFKYKQYSRHVKVDFYNI